MRSGEPVSFRVAALVPAVFHPDAAGGYWAEIPAMPGCIGAGDSLEETVTHIRDAAEGWLRLMHKHNLATSDGRS